MGIYINPKGQTKEEWLQSHAKSVTNGPPAAHYDPESDCVAVCLVDNGGFTAAAVAFDAREMQRFVQGGDGRDMIWCAVPVPALEAVLEMPRGEWLA